MTDHEKTQIVNDLIDRVQRLESEKRSLIAANAELQRAVRVLVKS